MNKICRQVFLISSILWVACTGGESVLTPTPGQPWVEEQVTFISGPNTLYGVLTKPASGESFPAIVMISGSADITTGTRAGVESRYFREHARQLAYNGFAVLRYDPPGTGQSTGESGFESLEVRADEAVDAVRYLVSRTDIKDDRVGLHGNSQGAWVNALAAADHPQDVAFIINVSGSGVSVAEQQVYSIEAQSSDAGFSDEEIAKAVLFGRLLVDWQVEESIYRDENMAAAESLGEGPWRDFLSLVYEPDVESPAEGLRRGIDILKTVQNEPWAEFLYLELYLPQLESIPVDQVAVLKSATGSNLIKNPETYFTKVVCPVLAIFGENDLLQPTELSAALYRQYLTEAGNEAFEIVVLPGVGHNIGVSTQGYWNVLTTWLDTLHPR